MDTLLNVISYRGEVKVFAIKVKDMYWGGENFASETTRAGRQTEDGGMSNKIFLKKVKTSDR